MTSPSPGAPGARPAASERLLVLIVDDYEKSLKLASDVLRAAGFRTLQAASGAEGLRLAAKEQPDVILLDLFLPDMGGTDVARELAAKARTARIPVVALSARRPAADADWLLAAGFAGYLEKPISVGAFPDQVRRYCARASA